MLGATNYSIMGNNATLGDLALHGKSIDVEMVKSMRVRRLTLKWYCIDFCSSLPEAELRERILATRCDAAPILDSLMPTESEQNHHIVAFAATRAAQIVEQMAVRLGEHSTGHDTSYMDLSQILELAEALHADRPVGPWTGKYQLLLLINDAKLAIALASSESTLTK